MVEVLENALKGKETANFEFPLYTKSGRAAPYGPPRLP